MWTLDIWAVKQAEDFIRTDAVNYPRMAYIEQRLHDRQVDSVSGATVSALDDMHIDGSTRAGDSIAVAVGSRGISQISTIVRETVRYLQDHGLKPFIVPAMGSHGGNSADGELAVLARLGITESSVAAPVKAGLDVVEIGTLDIGVPIMMARHAALADHIVVINRVKPHTKFHASIESGLTKMLTVGLGKGAGASLYHRAAVRHTFAILQDAARYILKQCPVLFGIGVLENGYRQVASIASVTPDNWFDAEQALLVQARSMLPTIPFDAIDVLIIDEIGKEISGIGMDSNVTGRHRDIVGDVLTAPHVKRIFVRDLSPNSDGNANGIGLADFTTTRLVDALDLEKTYANAIAAISPEKAALPMHFATDRQCLDACFRTIGMVEPENVRMVRIQNTLGLNRLLASKALEPDILSNGDLRLTTSWQSLFFDNRGNLAPM